MRTHTVHRTEARTWHAGWCAAQCPCNLAHRSINKSLGLSRSANCHNVLQPLRKQADSKEDTVSGKGDLVVRGLSRPAQSHLPVRRIAFPQHATEANPRLLQSA